MGTGKILLLSSPNNLVTLTAEDFAGIYFLLKFFLLDNLFQMILAPNLSRGKMAKTHTYEEWINRFTTDDMMALLVAHVAHKG